MARHRTGIYVSACERDDHGTVEEELDWSLRSEFGCSGEGTQGFLGICCGEFGDAQPALRNSVGSDQFLLQGRAGLVLMIHLEISNAEERSN